VIAAAFQDLDREALPVEVRRRHASMALTPHSR